jgi:uncharacterized membrane protein
MPDISQFCPSCGRAVMEGSFFPPDAQQAEAEVEDEHVGHASHEEPAAEKRSVEWNERLVSACAYMTFLPAVAFLFIPLYQGKKFVRYHAFQSIFFWVLVVVLVLLGYFASSLGWTFLWLLTGAVVVLALFFVWLVLSIKALQGEWFELPWLGPLAGQQAGR